MHSGMLGQRKPAQTEHPIHELIAERWSPRAFLPQAIAKADLHRLFEAGRWAPSCFNEQPWRFLVASRDEPALFQELLSLLNDGNRTWAQNAGALVLAMVKPTFAHNGKDNGYAHYDLGQAIAMLSIQATAMGIGVHQMAGFSKEAAMTTFGLGEELPPVAMLALGKPAAADVLDDALKAKEEGPRSRRAVSDIAFFDAAELLAKAG